MAAIILTLQTDLDSVRSYIGVTPIDFSDTDTQSLGFLPVAEDFITSRVNAQSGLGVSVPTVAQMLATTGPAVAADKDYLKAAVVYRIGYLFMVSESNVIASNVVISNAVTMGATEAGKDWKSQAREALAMCDQALGSITGYKRWRSL